MTFFESGRRILTVIVIACSGLLSVATLPQVSMAQREGTTRSPSERTPLVVRRSGDPEGVRWPDLDIAQPQTLTLAQLSQYLAPIGFMLSEMQGPWKVSSAEMTALSGRIRLAFTEAEMVTSQFAAIHGRPSVTYGQPTGAALLRLRALATGERYFIDCSVAPTSGSYRISGPGSTATFTGDGHVLATYVAVDTNFATFQIERLDYAEKWGFFSCVVSRLQ